MIAKTFLDSITLSLTNLNFFIIILIKSAIKMINKYGFEYYANYANTIYAFKPSFNNFKACLKRCNLINKLNQHLKVLEKEETKEVDL